MAAALPALRASAEYAPGLVGTVWVQVALLMMILCLLLWIAGHLLSLSKVMSLCHGEDFAELDLKFVDGLQGDHAVEAGQFVPKLDEHILLFV